MDQRHHVASSQVQKGSTGLSENTPPSQLALASTGIITLLHVCYI